MAAKPKVRRPKAGSYGSYLQIKPLLRLQKQLSRAHDELQFIVVHQVFELWFKLLIFELEATRKAMKRDDMVQALHYLKRVHAIVKLLTASFEVIETMRPYDFLKFRSLLDPGSGFQSLQFRELEYLSGRKEPHYLALFKGADRARLERRKREDSVWDAYLLLLEKKRLKSGSDQEVVASVIRILRDPDRHSLGPLTEALVDYDELFALWRARHIRMTMRMIGERPGTGRRSVANLVKSGYESMGAGGVDYLRTTLDKVFFPLLWEARTFVKR